MNAITSAEHPLHPDVIENMRAYANENDGVYRGVLWETIMTLCDEVVFLQEKLKEKS